VTLHVIVLKVIMVLNDQTSDWTIATPCLSVCLKI